MPANPCELFRLGTNHQGSLNRITTPQTLSLMPHQRRTDGRGGTTKQQDPEET